MKQDHYERLAEKYGSSKVQGSNKKEMNVMGRGNRDRAMSVKGKPKNLKATIVRMMKYLSHEKGYLSVAIICAVVCTVSTLAASYMLRPIMNHFLYYEEADKNIAGRLEGLAFWMGILAIVYAVSVVTQWLQQRLMLAVSQRSLKRMRTELYEHLQTLPIRYYDTHPVGDIMSRFTNDIDTIGEMLNTTLMQIISGSITIVGTIFLMMYTSPILGSITLIMTPILTWASKIIIQKGRGAYVKQQQNLGMLNGFAEEMITGQKVVKVFNREGIAREEFDYLNDRLCEAQIKAQFRAGIMGPITHQLCNLSFALTACVGGILVVTRGFDIGGLTISVDYTRRFNRPINEISMQMNTVFAALAGAERVFEVLDEMPEKPDTDTAAMEKIEGHVILDRVHFGYEPGVPVLHDISLYAKPGQKIAFVGSTGAGKTTITNLLSRFYDIEQG